jgi:hypothetical protein
VCVGDERGGEDRKSAVVSFSCAYIGAWNKGRARLTHHEHEHDPHGDERREGRAVVPRFVEKELPRAGVAQRRGEAVERAGGRDTRGGCAGEALAWCIRITVGGQNGTHPSSLELEPEFFALELALG